MLCLTNVVSEFQQVVIGMKREHKENLNRLTQNQEVSLFNFRGEVAQKLNEKDEKILQLEHGYKDTVTRAG